MSSDVRTIRRMRPWRWKCPHCLGGLMTLDSARTHLRRRHSDCWSCHVEKVMVEAMMTGHEFVSTTERMSVGGGEYKWTDYDLRPAR